MQNRKPRVQNAYLVMLFDGLCVSSASVVLPLLRQNYGLSYDFSGLLLALLSVGNLASALLCGVLPRWWGVRRTALTFTGGLLAGYLLLSVSGVPAVLALGFLCIGLGKGSSMNNATVAAGEASADRTKSVNLINALFALGSLCAPLLYLGAGMLPDWKAPLLALAVSGGVVWLLFWTMGLSSRRSDAAKRDDWSFLKDRHFWFSTAFLFGQQCAEISVTGWLVTYFKDQGILTGALSELTVTVMFAAMLLGRLFIVFVLPPRFRSLLAMSAASLVSYLLLMSCQSGITALLCLFLFGLSISGTYPTVIAQANRSLSNASVGVMLPVAGIGAVLMPYLVGAVAEHGGIRAGMLCPIAALVLMLVFAVCIRRSEQETV
ncbi:MAG: MFS transporter [Gemmiger sp.]